MNVACNPATGKCEYEEQTEPPADFVYSWCEIPVCTFEKGWHTVNKTCPNDDPCVKMVCDAEQQACVGTKPCNDNDWCTNDKCITEVVEEMEEYEDGTHFGTYTYEENGGEILQAFYKVRCSFEPKVAPTGFLGAGEACFEPVCDSENRTWVKRVLPEAFTDPCGGCVEDYDQYLEGSQESTICIAGITKNEFASALGGTAIAGVIVAAVIGAAVVAVSGVFGTKELIARAGMTAGQSVQNNPFYKDNANEMVNPTFDGDDGFNF